MSQTGHSSVPLYLTSLIGRDDLLARLLGLISAGHRLVTLTGPGGVGKTRLAIALGFALDAQQTFASTLVELAPVPHDEQILSAIASALTVPDNGTERLDVQIARHVGTRPHVL